MNTSFITQLMEYVDEPQVAADYLQIIWLMDDARFSQKNKGTVVDTSQRSGVLLLPQSGKPGRYLLGNTYINHSNGSSRRISWLFS